MPQLTNEQLTRAIDLKASVYANHAAGCCLHIVLDDGNYSDDTVQFCKKEAVREAHAECSELCDLLLLMSRTQRHKLSTGGYTGFREAAWRKWRKENGIAEPAAVPIRATRPFTFSIVFMPDQQCQACREQTERPHYCRCASLRQAATMQRFIAETDAMAAKTNER